ncbi:MAG: histidine phosphatase family protein [Candidatus Heimdallarchaeaceae archaeon]
MRIFLVRHGETDHNKERVIMGQLDIHLNKMGRMQSERLMKALENKNIEVIYTSDLSRAVETAEIINKELKVPLILSKGLREHTLGKLDGITIREFLEKFTSVMEFEKHILPEGGEKIDVFKERVWKEFQNIIQREKSKKNILVVSHGGSMRVIIQKILNADDVIFDSLQQDNCCIDILNFREKNAFPFSIELLNDCSHLN